MNAKALHHKTEYSVGSVMEMRQLFQAVRVRPGMLGSLRVADTGHKHLMFFHLLPELVYGILTL